ncbi:MAG: hypothetical protein B6D41_00145 [Chloroflexi bacterium UTCFX4]|jgi:hypothetical protein|nr:MAG: hypothetical protein B6D41_00145 [Chloroflexi bacterium UTCFX4]
MSKSEPTTQLHGRWLTLARAAWAIIAVFYIGAFLVSVPLKLTEIPDFTTSTAEGVTQAEFLAGLAQLGISPTGYIAFQQWSNILVGLIYLVLAVFIFWRKSNDGMAILTSLVFIMFWGPFETLARFNPIWTTVGEIFALVTSITFIGWFFIFPDGHFVPRWMRWLYLGLLATQVWRIFQPDIYQRSFPFLIPIIFGGILLAQVYRYRHAGVAQRQQIKWVVFGICAGAASLLVFALYYFAVLNSQPPLARAIGVNFWGNFLWMFFVLILPISLTFAILRSRLFDIDIIIRKTVTYTLVVALLAAVYFGSVILLQQLFANITGQRSEVITVLSTLAIAALFVPLRNRIQDAIDKRFYRKKYDAQKVLQKFSETVRDETDLDKLTAELVKVVQETMQPKSVSVWLKKTGDGETGRQGNKK